MRPALLACLIALSAAAAPARAWHDGAKKGRHAGDEGRFPHAPRPGAKVRVDNVMTPYWRQRFDGPRRWIRPRFS